MVVRPLVLAAPIEPVIFHPPTAHLHPGFSRCYAGTPDVAWSGTVADALIVVAVVCVVSGILGVAAELLADRDKKGWWYAIMERTIGYETYVTCTLVVSVLGAAMLSWVDLATDLVVMHSYFVCGAYWWFGAALVILLASTAYISWNASKVAEGDFPWYAHSVASVLHCELFIEGLASVRAGAKSVNFARAKFLEGLLESCPQAFLSMYVLYAMDAHSHFWLVASACSSILSLAYGLSEWLELGVEEKLSPTLWYHHMVRTSYLSVDFALRLLTVTLMLIEKWYYPSGPLLLLGIILLYISVIGRYTPEWPDLLKVFSLTYFANLLPCELRVRTGNTPYLYLVDAELRSQLLNPVLALRAADFVLCTLFLLPATTWRRGICLALLLGADAVLYGCVRLVTRRLERQHDEDRSSYKLSEDSKA